MWVQYSLFIVLAMDDYGNAQPVAFCLTEKDDADTLSRMLDSFRAAVQAVRSDWWPSCFLLDDDAAEHKAVRCAHGTAAGTPPRTTLHSLCTHMCDQLQLRRRGAQSTAAESWPAPRTAS